MTNVEIRMSKEIRNPNCAKARAFRSTTNCNRSRPAQPSGECRDKKVAARASLLLLSCCIAMERISAAIKINRRGRRETQRNAQSRRFSASSAVHYAKSEGTHDGESFSYISFLSWFTHPFLNSLTGRLRTGRLRRVVAWSIFLSVNFRVLSFPAFLHSLSHFLGVRPP